MRMEDRGWRKASEAPATTPGSRFHSLSPCRANSRPPTPFSAERVRASLCALALVCAFAPAPAAAQRVLEAKGFQTADYFDPPHETQMKSLLTGSRARPLENDQVLVYDGTELRTFRESGEPELIVRSSEYVYDQRAQTASSAAPLHVQTADGRFSIDGEGFLWQQTNSALFISNRVHTVAQPDPRQSSGAIDDARGSAPRNPIEIFSRRFEYQRGSGLGIYSGDVRVAGTNLSLCSGRLSLKVPVTDPPRRTILETITAEENVSMAYEGIQATGQLAVYSAATGLATVSGHPAWRADQREGRADELVIDRTNRIFRANGHAWLRMPGQTLGGSGFLSKSRASAAGRGATTNRVVEIVSDNYEFRTNWAAFRQDVHVSEVVSNRTGGTLTCALLTAHFTGTNDLQKLVAEKNVVIQEEDNRFTGETAVFTGTNGVLELTGPPEPTWQAGLRSGKGKLVRVDTEHDEMLVRGEASMRLPAEELGQASVLPAAAASPPPKPAGPQFADIFCQEYRVRPEYALFQGNVRAAHPRLNVACGTLTVLAPPTAEKVLIAEQQVTFDLISEKGDKIHGTGDKAVYTNNITSTLTNDLLTLTGAPARLATDKATNENNVIVLDRAHNQLITRGDYRVYGTAKAIDTNLFALPKNKLLKQ